MKKRKIGMISPAYNLLPVFPKRREEGKKNLEEIGIEPVFLKNAVRDYSVSKKGVKERVKEINEMVKQDVDCIMATMGGFTSIQTLDDIDYETIKEKKISFCGFSDITSLLLACYTKTGNEMYYGPVYTVNMCDYGGVDSYTRDSLLECLEGKKMELKPSSYYMPEFIDWADLEHEVRIKKQVKKNNDWKYLQEGTCKGKLIGGNLQTFLLLIGTEYLPKESFKDKILFIEECEMNMDEFCSHLESLRLNGILDSVKGILIGKFDTPEMNEGIEEFVKDYFKDYKKPVVYNMDFGHVFPICTLPIGREATVECKDKKIKIELSERK